jgi:two-component system sensor kinase FixL
MELQQNPGDLTAIDLASMLDEFRIVAAPGLQDFGIEASWSVAANLPPVWADRKALMLICLNLTQNSTRVLKSAPSPHFSISAYAAPTGDKVFVEFTDNGPGVAHPDRLFRPFQPDAQSTGLGLYLSRAFARSFRGDLVFIGNAPGARFRLELEPADDPDDTSDFSDSATHTTGAHHA